MTTDDYNDIVELKNEIAELSAELIQTIHNPIEQLIARVNSTLFECQRRTLGIFPDEISQDAVDAIEYFL